MSLAAEVDRVAAEAQALQAGPPDQEAAVGQVAGAAAAVRGNPAAPLEDQQAAAALATPAAMVTVSVAPWVAAVRVRKGAARWDQAALAVRAATRGQ